MPLPPELNRAIATPGGGRVSLILGAGCSYEAPTNVPLSRTCSREIHAQLVADAVLNAGECPAPEDLSVLADTVFAKTNSQRALVDRMRDRYQLHLRPPNEGYLLAAALLCEGAIMSIVTLNFDTAISTAISVLGCGEVVGVIESPRHLDQQKGRNIYYLHRSANSDDPDTWVLRTVTIQQEWQGNWEQAITSHALVQPVIVFCGIGTAVTVLLESVRLMRQAIPGACKTFVVGPSDPADSNFFRQMNLTAENYIKLGWCHFMRDLADRLLREHCSQITHAAEQKTREQGLQAEDLTNLLVQLQTHGLEHSGRMRATWMQDDVKPYLAFANNAPLVADLLLAIALIARVSNTNAALCEDGMVEFRRGALVTATVILASGCGHRQTAAIEARINQRKHRWRGHRGATR